MENQVHLYTKLNYDKKRIKECISNSGVLKVVLPTDTVVLKPNFVQENRDRDLEWEFVITHPTIISAVIELLLPVLKGRGKIILADAPMTASSFEKILSHMPVDEWKHKCEKNSVLFEIVDLRDEEWVQSINHVTLKRKKLPGDPMGKVLFNLREEQSEFCGKNDHGNQYYGADYNIEETNKAHNGFNNLYSVSRTVIAANVFINLPKLKSHRKGGVTCCLKNLVGINTNKNLLPHHTIGSPKEGGDEFEISSAKTSAESRLANLAKRIAFKCSWLAPMLVPLKKIAFCAWGGNDRTIRNGSWYGNDTLWRTILDLNKVMYYGNEDGSLREDKYVSKKRYVAIVDAIYGGEGDGPMNPDKVDCGCLIIGDNPVSVDCVAVKIMGFSWKKIPQIYHAFGIECFQLFEKKYEDIICKINDSAPQKLRDITMMDFPRWKCAPGWEGHIENNGVE